MTDHRIESDDYLLKIRKLKLKKDEKLCTKCEGTGNQFLFMYRECDRCKGTGVVKRSKKIRAVA